MKRLIYPTAILVLLLSYPTSAQQTQTDYDPGYQKYVMSLPAIDKVEILAVTGLRGYEWESADCAKPDIICKLPNGLPVRILASKTLAGEGAHRISSLWRSLRRGNGAGCFAPAYVLRFYQNETLLLETEVCFHCCNITLPDQGIASMCGSEKAIGSFKKFVTKELPFPKARR